jgi:hypothetical protein
MSVPRSFDIVDLGTRELGPPEYPRAALLPASYRQVAGGCRADKFTGCDHVLITEGDIGHSWSGSSTTSPGQSYNRNKRFLYLICPYPPLAS